MPPTKTKSQRDAELAAVKGQRVMRAPVVDVKAFTDDEHPAGTFAAVVAVFDNIDSTGDRIRPGAFTNTLKAPPAGDGLPPEVWAHDWMTPPIGVKLEAREATKPELEDLAGRKLDAIGPNGGLYTVSRLFVGEDEHHAIAQQIYAGMKAVDGQGRAALRQYSFAYRVVKAEWVEEDVATLPPELQWTGGEIRDLVELKLRETGPCLLGVNTATDTLGVKARVAELESLGLIDHDAARKALRKLDETEPAPPPVQRGPSDDVKAVLDRYRSDLVPPSTLTVNA